MPVVTLRCFRGVTRWQHRFSRRACLVLPWGIRDLRLSHFRQWLSSIAFSWVSTAHRRLACFNRLCCAFFGQFKCSQGSNILCKVRILHAVRQCGGLFIEIYSKSSKLNQSSRPLRHLYHLLFTYLAHTFLSIDNLLRRLIFSFDNASKNNDKRRDLITV